MKGKSENREKKSSGRIFCCVVCHTINTVPVPMPMPMPMLMLMTMTIYFWPITMTFTFTSARSSRARPRAFQPRFYSAAFVHRICRPCFLSRFIIYLLLLLLLPILLLLLPIVFFFLLCFLFYDWSPMVSSMPGIGPSSNPIFTKFPLAMSFVYNLFQ